jgi:hypothetical protein
MKTVFSESGDFQSEALNGHSKLIDQARGTASTFEIETRHSSV